MPDKKLTDSEIVKALKCCVSEHEDCENCQAYDFCKDNSHEMVKATLDLINRLQAENERLGNQTTTYITTILKLINEAERRREDRESAMQFAADIVAADKTLKAQAYKKCIEKVKEIINGEDVILYRGAVNYKLDNLLKELVNEDNGNK